MVFSGLSAANAATVTMGSTFIGDAGGTFGFGFTSTDPGIMLQSITFNLQSPLFLDPTLAPPGVLLPIPLVPLTSPIAVGLSGGSGVSDGSTSFTLNFSDFNPGEIFGFELDVDAPCGNIFCLIPASTTTGNEFAGTTMTAVFGGAGFDTTSISGTFISTGLFTAGLSTNGTVDASAVPEPGTTALLGMGLAAAGFLRRRVKKAEA